MLFTQHIRQRLSFKYVGPCKDLDESIYIGEFQVMGSEIETLYDSTLGEVNQELEDPSYVPTIIYTGQLILQQGSKISKKHCSSCSCRAAGERCCLTQEEIEAAIEESFSSIGCSCEYDCCGCISERCHIDPKQSRPEDGFYRLIINRSANY